MNGKNGFNNIWIKAFYCKKMFVFQNIFGNHVISMETSKLIISSQDF